jgi:hypothetical protein
MCRVAVRPQIVPRHIFENGFDVAAGQPCDRLAVEFRIGTMLPELARTAELE